MKRSGKNLLYGNPSATSSDLDSVAALTQLDRVLHRLPRGLDEPWGHWAAGFLGAKGKRLALARTLLQQPRILIVDEITSSSMRRVPPGCLMGSIYFAELGRWS